MAVQFPVKMAAARFKLSQDRPYLSSALWALIPVHTPGLGTLGVDKHWRLYYDPEVVDRWTVAEISAVLYHEVYHLIRDHAHRSENMRASLDSATAVIWNLAADMEENDDLREEGIQLPQFKNADGSPMGGCVYPDTYELPKHLLAEEYYSLLRDVADIVRCDGCGCSQPASGGGSSPPSQAGQQPHPSSSSNGNGQHQNPADAPLPPGKKFRIIVHSHDPHAGSGSCGSCANGHKQSWEDGDPSTNKPGLQKEDGDMIRREVAKRIQDSSANCGNIAAGWKRWAEKLLKPKVDWRRELPALIRGAVGARAGCVDYSYRRPCRRQASYGKIIMPSMYAPEPKIMIEVDTSGSMSDEKICQCLAEIQGVLNGCGVGSKVTVLFVDAAVHAVQNVFAAKQLVPLGGGGTDMNLGIQYAEQQQQKPDILIILTDCETPWQEQPPSFSVIIGRIGNGHVPSWAKVVDIEFNETR